MCEYLFILYICAHREKTGLNVCGQDMEACPDSKFRTFGEPTDISLRLTQSLLSIPPVNLEFHDTTLTVADGVCGRREYLCGLLNLKCILSNF
jgi:hypothetical protein